MSGVLTALGSILPTAGGGGFTPTDLASLSLWLKADGSVYNSGTTQATDGQTVETWVDASGDGHDATEATNKPTFQTGEINGLPAIRFDGSTTMMMVADHADLELNTDLTIVAVVKTNFAGSRTLIYKGSNAPSAGALNYLVSVSPIEADRPYVAAGTAASSGLTDGVWTVVSLRISGTTVNHYLNGSGNGSSSLVTGTATNNAMRIGVFNDGSNSGFFNGDIAEIVICNAALSVSDREALEDYEGSKYAIVISH